jgi:hypothetical protein
MRKPKLIETYTRLTKDAVSPFTHSVIRQTSSSAFIKDGAVLSRDLTVAVQALDADVAAIDYPTPAQTSRRDQLRAATTAELSRLARRLNLDYEANQPALLSSGLTLGATNTASALRTLVPDTVPVVFDLLDGGQPGSLLLKLARPTGTIQNLIRYTTNDTLPEDNWCVAVGGGREREIGPFEPGTRVFVKAAALATATVSPLYSDVKSRIVQ